MNEKAFICRQPNDFTGSPISITEIKDIHWDYVSGGVHAKSGYYSLYGYIDYSLAQNLVKCSGRHNFGYNTAKICIPYGTNQEPEYKKGYAILKAEAGPKPPSIISTNRPSGAPPCTKAILAEVKNHGNITRGSLRNILLNKGYKSSTILSALRRLYTQKKIIFEGSSNSKNQIIRLS